MISKSIRYKDSFIVNGNFEDGLQQWTVNDPMRVVKAIDRWDDKDVSYMHALDQGAASQTLILAQHPRPDAEKAVYELRFWYEAYGGENASVRIVTGLGEETNLALVPSLKVEFELPLDPDVLLDLNLTEYSHRLELDPVEVSVEITFISPADAPNRRRGLRVTFVRVELLLEPLRLESLSIDEEQQAPNEPLRLCLGALGNEAHEVLLNLADDSAWQETRASLLVEEGNIDPMLSAQPIWEQEQAIDSFWYISCVDSGEDEQYEHTLNVRSQYTADLYDVSALSGHFRLDVIALQEAIYYPVVCLEQSVELRVRVQSHYTHMSLANREVTWTVSSPGAAAPVLLLKQRSDENGEASFIYSPDEEGLFQITASVDSHYKKDDAKHVFEVRALQEDPWLQATFSLDRSSSPSPWGRDQAYPCRGASHEVTVTFPAGHALAGTDLALLWQGEDTPDGLGVVINPPLDEPTPIDGAGLTWNMAFENRRDSDIELNVRCSRLLEASPSQALRLAHNWLEVSDTNQSSRFPMVGGPPLYLKAQVRSRVPGVGTVPGIDVQWLIDGELSRTLPTGAEGWSEYPFDLDEDGTFTVTARLENRYENNQVEHPFRVVVLGESPWQSLATVSLGGRDAGNIGLICFRDDEPAELKVSLVGEMLLGEEIFLEVTDPNGEPSLVFDAVPPLEDMRRLPLDGLTWAIRSDAASSRFLLRVHHAVLPLFELPGLLLSRVIDGEGDLQFDEEILLSTAIAYPCLGAVHSLRFIPKVGSPLNTLALAAIWDPDALPIVLDPAPGISQELESGGARWNLDCRASNESGGSGLSLKFPQIDVTYLPVSLNLGHNRVEIDQVRGPTADPEVGESVFLDIHVRSYYTQRSLGGIQVAFGHGTVSTSTSTDGDGWARYPFMAEAPGEVRVIATAPSPYDAPEASPRHEFVVTVLGR
ncbi:hypothetical protein OC610_05920 [Pseudomonas sp. SAICEU22]|uniref:Ig-like domain (Group 3) n=1 Tax=Pseudomonas agronomica TaxID=2979328 RepID=A0ABT3F619_9PSED|nr:hypothetical protein [Pseudomonas agronomica]MCW1243935.1 hypothetical protein [Pseudomonas agronomica]